MAANIHSMLAAFIGLTFSLFANCQHNQLLLLTDGANGHKPIDYAIADQCMANAGQGQINSFGILFHLHPLYLCEPEGLLICYPGQLDGNSSDQTGMAAKIPLQVDNLLNEVAQRCEAKRKEFCEANPKSCAHGGIGSLPWHGILLQTIHQGQTIVMSLSITDNRYDFGNRENFWVQFGNETSVFTSIRLPGKKKRLLFHEDDQLRKDFLSNVGRGVRLNKYTGIWMLGLDMLPTEAADDQLNLFVYRGCQCAIHAWFTKPADGPFLPAETDNLTIGHNLCPAKNTFADIVLGEVKEDQMIVLQMLVDENAKNMGIGIMDKEKRSIWSMAMDEDGVSFYPSGNVIQGPIMKKGQKLRVEVRFHRFYYAVAYGSWSSTVIERIWHNQWWNGSTTVWESAGGYIHLEGDMQLLSKAFMIQAPSATLSVINAPYALRLENFVLEYEVHFLIRGRVMDGAKWMQINLLHDAREWNEYIGVTPLRISIDFETGNLTLANSTIKHDHRNEWSPNSTWANPFRQNSLFECRIGALVKIDKQTGPSTLFEVEIDVENEATKKMGISLYFPLWLLDWIRFDGDFQLLAVPEIKKKVDGDKIDTKVHVLPRLLLPGDRICIGGRVGTDFIINFQYQSSQFNKIFGDTPFLLKFNLSAARGEPQFIANTFDRLSGYAYSPKRGDGGTSPIGWVGGQFTIEIRVKFHKYHVIFNNNSNPDDDFFYGHQKPFWMAQYVELYGDIEDIDVIDCGGGRNIAALPTWVKQIDADVSPLEAGKIVRIEGRIEMPDPATTTTNGVQPVVVNFFHGALSWDEHFGQTILQANFTPNEAGIEIKINSYMGYKWLLKNRNDHSHQVNGLGNGQLFSLKIAITDEHYELRFGNNTPYLYAYKELGVPPWAIQYIVVQGTKEWNGPLASVSIEIE